MGLVTYADRKSGELVQAEFPLNPSLVAFTKADGSTGQLFRQEFDAAYGQKLPDLPKVSGDALPEGEHDPAILAPPPYEAPTITKLSPSGTVPTSHVAWFMTLLDRIKSVETKIETVIEAVLKAAAPASGIEVRSSSPPAMGRPPADEAPPPSSEG